MQTISELFKFILESNIINFCLMVWLLVWICKKMDFGSIFTKSVKSVEDYIEKSKEEKQNSNNLVFESKKLIEKLPSQISEIEKFNKQKCDIFRKQLEASTKKSVEKLNNNIERIIEIEEKKVSNAVTEYSFRKSVEKAQTDIVSMLESKPELHKKFIDESLEELEKLSCR